MVSALDDSVDVVFYHALEEIHELGILDSLIKNKVIKRSHLNRISTDLSSQLSHGGVGENIPVYPLVFTLEPSDQDLNVIDRCMELSDLKFADNISGYPHQPKYIDSSVANVLRPSLKQEIFDIPVRYEIARLLILQNPVPRSDISDLIRFLTSRELKKDKQKHYITSPGKDLTDTELDSLTITAMATAASKVSQNPELKELLVEVYNRYSSEDQAQVDNFHRAILELLASVDLKSNRTFPAVLARMQGAKELDNGVHYFSILTQFPVSLNREYSDLGTFLNSQDCQVNAKMLQSLINNRPIPENTTLQLLRQFIKREKCGDLRLTYLPTFNHIPAATNPLLPAITKIEPTSHQARVRLIDLILQNKEATPSYLTIIKKHYASDEDQAELLTHLYYNRDIHPDALLLLDKSNQKNTGIALRESFAWLLSQQQNIPRSLVSKLPIIVRNFRASNALIKAVGNVAQQEPMQREILIDIATALASPFTAATDQLMIKLSERESIPEFLLKDFRSQLLKKPYKSMYFSHLRARLPQEDYLTIINGFDQLDAADVDVIRYAIHISSQGSAELTKLLNWVSKKDFNIAEARKLSFEQKEDALLFFDSAWTELADNSNIKIQLAKQTVALSKSLSYKELSALESVISGLRNKFNKDRQIVQGEKLQLDELLIESNSWYTLLIRFWPIALLHPLFWLALVFLYPKNEKVQSIFFWNDNVRKIGGLGYVNLALIHVPFLRNKILNPFKQNMLGEALIEEVSSETYFRDFTLTVQSTGQSVQPEYLHSIKNQVIIRGESGVGKTMLLQHLIKTRPNDAVFVKAAECRDGVEAAVSSKMLGIATETNFVKPLLYNGYLHIYIDGINEVSPDTRVLIAQFLKTNKKCQCTISTQPIAWDIPQYIETLELNGLNSDTILKFLKSRYPTLKKDSPLSQKQYDVVCVNFMNSPSVNKSGAQVLSNPFDLTIISQLLSLGNQTLPNFFRLQKEYFDKMIVHYESTNSSTVKFQLSKISKQIMSQMADDNVALYERDFALEIQAMHRFKMVLPIYRSKEERAWHFRHEKIRDFFLLQVFLNEPSNQTKYMNDPRFRGVYFLLASYLPVEDADALERHLINNAVDNKDHSLSDEFIKLLRERPT